MSDGASRSRLVDFSRKSISRAPASDRAGRYFFETRAHELNFLLLIDETTTDDSRPTRCAPLRSNPPRPLGPLTTHTVPADITRATAPRSTRTCAQDGVGLEEEARRLSEPAGGRARLESRRLRAHAPRGEACAPARAAAVVSRPLHIAVGRACEGAGEESVRACLKP